jgi:hypothetical protein
MALPSNVQAQVDVINVNVNRVIANRQQLEDWFNDRLGASIWSLVTASNQTIAKNALVADLQTAITALQQARDALAAM